MKRQDKRLTRIDIRVSHYEKNRIKMFAKLYADGNLSAWLLHASETAERKFLKNKEPGKARATNPGSQSTNRKRK